MFNFLLIFLFKCVIIDVLFDLNLRIFDIDMCWIFSFFVILKVSFFFVLFLYLIFFKNIVCAGEFFGLVFFLL